MQTKENVLTQIQKEETRIIVRSPDFKFRT